MDSEWSKTPKFIYGKVLEGSGKFRGHAEKVRNILEGVGPGQPGWPHWARPTRAGWPGAKGQAEWGRESPSPPPCELERWEDSLLPTSFFCVLFPVILASWSLDWFEQETQ